MAIDYEYRGSATITPDLTEYNKLQSKADVQAGEASNIAGAGKVLGKAAVTAVNEYQKASAEKKDEKDTVDAYTAMTEERTVMMELEANNDPMATEQYIRIQQTNLEKEFLEGKISKGTFQGKMSVLKNKEEKAYKEGQDLRDNKIAVVEKDSMIAKLADNDYSEEDYNYLVKRGMSPKAALSLLRDAMYEAGNSNILSTTTFESLNEKQIESKAKYDKAFKENPYTNSKEWNAQVKALETNRKAIVTGQQKLIKYNSKQTLATNLQQPVPLGSDAPSVQQDLDIAYGDDPMARMTKGASYQKEIQTKWDEHHIKTNGRSSIIL